MQSSISFILDGKLKVINVTDDTAISPTTTVLNYLRSLPAHKGVKEGCAEGDCGACTIVLGERSDGSAPRYKSVDSCLVFLPMLHGKEVITVENLKSNGDNLHPVQQAMVETDGSQCGYCTPGFIMSLFSLYKNINAPSRDDIDDALTGNLCRCTGYRPIVEAAAQACVHHGKDQFSKDEQSIATTLMKIPRESLHLKTLLQQYYRPISLGEAITLKHRHPDAIIISGATDVALRVTKKHELLNQIIDLTGVEELQHIAESDSAITVGAGVTLSDLMLKTKNDFPALYHMLKVFGSQQIRNLATLGGNLGTASPIGDTLPVLMAYEARVILEGLNGKREIPIDSYFTGYRTTLRKPDEIIISVIIPKPPPGVIVTSYKISKRKDLDISTVSAGFRLALDEKGKVASIILSYGGMAERIKRAVTTEKYLIGKPWHRQTVEDAMSYIDQDFTPIADARAGIEMRKIAARNILLKFWSETSHS